MCRFFFGRFRRLFIAFNGRFEMFFSCHQVVSQRHAGSVAEPACDNLHGIKFNQFRFTARPHVVKHPGPELQARTFDDLSKRRS